MAPLTLSVSLPSSKRMRVGIPLILNLAASWGFASVLTCTTAPLPANSLAASCTAGAKSRQWGHHGAQNSAITGPWKLFTNSSKFLSDRTTGLV